VKCLNGMWCTLLPEFMHNFTGFQPVENTVEDMSRLVQEAGLYKVTTEDATELLDSYGQKLLNEYLEELAEELNQ